MKRVKTFDVVMTRLVGRLPKSLHKYFDGLGYMTMPVVWAVVVAIFAGTVMHGGGPVAPPLIILACIPLAAILKLFIKRRRPMTIYADAMKVKSYSFPSSHAYSSALAGGYLAAVAFSHGMVLLGTTLIALILLIGISRVHLGAHYPSDVVAGWIMGVSLQYLVAGI